MQSGISVSEHLHAAFRTFTSSSDQRALFADITDETLVPGLTIPSSNPDFKQDLHLLQTHLSPTTATYILLKTHPDEPNGFAAITYVPNAAPVRQKMLFASTRLTLARELGIERFRTTVFATEKHDLSARGWEQHEAHEGLAAPLTEEEAGLAGVKAAEAHESQGTGVRRGHVEHKVDVALGEGVLDALRSLHADGCRGTLVQLKYALPDETLQLESSADGVEPARVASCISTAEPRYSFYSHPARAEGAAPFIFFLYTCPVGSKIKERMVYSTGKGWTRTIAERDAEIAVTKSLEATEPEELTADLVAAGGGGGEAEAETPAKAGAGGFARPKRPGRR